MRAIEDITDFIFLENGIKKSTWRIKKMWNIF